MFRTLGRDDYFDRFWAQVPITDGCWIWGGGKNRLGYGRFRMGRVTLYAHRAGWLLTYGQLPEPPLVLRHSCDTPSCVRLGHLVVGTKRENTLDAVERGRISHGERHPSSKLTLATIAEARALRSQGVLWKHLARKYGVTEATIVDACSGRSWRCG